MAQSVAINWRVS